MRRYQLRRPSLEEARAKATAWAAKGGPDGQLRSPDHAAFIERWTAEFQDMDLGEFNATGPTGAPPSESTHPATPKHPRSLTWAELRAVMDQRSDLPKLEAPYDLAKQVAHAQRCRDLLTAEWEAINGSGGT